YLRHWHVRGRIFAHGAGTDRVHEVWYDRSLGRFPNSRESSLGFEFFWRDLLRVGGTGTCLGYGRRNRESEEEHAGSSGLGRRPFRAAVYRRDPHLADCSEQGQHQRARGNCAGGEPHGWAAERRV